MKPRRMSWAGHEAGMKVMKYIKNCLENLRERGHLKDLRIDGKIKLESVL